MINQKYPSDNLGDLFGSISTFNLEQQSVVDVLKLIEKHRQVAYRKINEQLVSLYFEIGKYLSEKVENQPWGSKIIQSVAFNVRQKYPTLKGFNRPGLYRMIQFYESYRDNVIVSSLLTQISWTNHLLILSGAKSFEEKEFYVLQKIQLLWNTPFLVLFLQQ